MSENDIRSTADGSPEHRLAALILRDLSVSVSARELRMFIRANWRKISAYSHEIHCNEKKSQNSSEG